MNNIFSSYFLLQTHSLKLHRETRHANGSLGPFQQEKMNYTFSSYFLLQKRSLKWPREIRHVNGSLGQFQQDKNE
jgi:hypothetical protein